MSAALHRTIAVTGASGFIGRRLVLKLLETGATVRELSRTKAETEGTRTLRPVRGDLRDAASLAPLLHGADAVVHLAGMAHTTLRTTAEEAEAAAVNVAGTRNLLRAALSAGVPQFVYVSSAHVYAGQQGIDLREDDAKDAGTGYGAMKLEAEELLSREGANLEIKTVLRPCLVYGPGVRHNLQQLMVAVQAGRYVHPGNADTMRSFASVDTVAAAILYLLQHRLSGTYNVADRQPHSLRQWVNALAQQLGARTPRTVPASVLRTIAVGGSIASRAGLSMPLTTESLRKLTAPFTLNLDRLISAGFAWPATNELVLREMVVAKQGRRSKEDQS